MVNDSGEATRIEMVYSNDDTMFGYIGEISSQSGTRLRISLRRRSSIRWWIWVSLKVRAVIIVSEIEAYVDRTADGPVGWEGRGKGLPARIGCPMRSDITFAQEAHARGARSASTKCDQSDPVSRSGKKFSRNCALAGGYAGCVVLHQLVGLVVPFAARVIGTKDGGIFHRFLGNA